MTKFSKIKRDCWIDVASGTATVILNQEDWESIIEFTLNGGGELSYKLVVDSKTTIVPGMLVDEVV